MCQSKCSTSAKPGLIFVVFFALSLTGCDLSFMGDEVNAGTAGPDGGGNNQGGNNDPMEVTVSGHVGVSAVTNSFIIVTTVNGAAAWTGASSNASDYAATTTLMSTDFPLTSRAFGGSDMVSGFSPDFDLRSTVLNAATTVANINPLSTIITATAGSQGRGINGSSLAVAKQVILQKLNFGFDASRISDPITSPIQNSNVATFFRSNQALAEMIRRTCRALLLAGFSLSADQAIAHLSGDLTDGVIDGRGIGSDARVAATSSIVSAQILLETMTNELQVGGFDAGDRIDAAISNTHPGATIFTGDLTAPAAMIGQAALTTAAAYDLSPTAANAALFEAVSAIPTGATVSVAGQILPPDTAVIMDAAIAKVAAGTASDHEVVNARMRMGFDPNVIDNTPPIISLVGSSTIPLFVGDSYVELGATATDDRNGDLTSLIIIDNQNVDTAVAKDYFVTYNVSDMSGNAAVEAIRTVSVSATDASDTVPPVITLVGANPFNLVQGDSYVEPGAAATDNVDGDLTSNISIDSSAVTTATVGNYPVTYNVSDGAGNAASPVYRTVVVQSTVGGTGNRPWEALLNEAAGFGGNVTGGAGGQLITVTNLNDSGSGSLRAALTVSGKTWIRFAPGLTGTITLNGHLSPGSDTTIDGRGANITIQRPTDTGDGAIFYLSDTNNVIFSYLKLGPARLDCMRFFNDVNGVWLHHLTLQGAGDELLDINRRIDNVTISWSHFYNAVYGVLTDGGINADMTSKYTFHHNYFDGVTQRTPLLRSCMAHVYNNYTRSWAWGSTTASEYSELYWENNIADAAGASNKKAAFSGGSVSSLPMGDLRSVGSHFLLNGAYVVESNRQSVFDPRSHYSYTPDIANTALRDAIVNGAGWQNVPFPE